MKFSVNINYDIEAESFSAAQEVVTALVEERTFAASNAKVTSFNMYQTLIATEASLARGATPVGS